VTKQANVPMLFHLLLPNELAPLLERLGYTLSEDQLRRSATGCG
jgi:hypothetical protein